MNARTDINMKPKIHGGMKSKIDGRKSVDKRPSVLLGKDNLSVRGLIQSRPR
jgi:hypothetical protein